MKLKEWLDNSNISMSALARISGLERQTITRLLSGVKPHQSTITKLVIATRGFKPPITREMFE